MQMAYERIQPGQGHEAGRALLARLYSQYRSGEMPDIVLEDGGKPRFVAGYPHFSISHTKAHVFCVLADEPVGIDAEEKDRKINLRLAEKILSPGEKRQFEAAPDPRLTLLKFWVLKEAQAKCTGEGLKGYPNHTNFSLSDPRVRQMQGCLVAVVEEEDHVI